MASHESTDFPVDPQDHESSPGRPKHIRQPKYPHIVVDGVEMKHCGICGYKPLSAFSAAKGRWDGLCSWCKDCSASQQKRWRDEHQEEQKEYFKEYHEQHKAEKKVKKHLYYEANKEKVLQQASKWAIEHPEENRLYHQEYYVSNREKLIEEARARRAANIEERRAKEREYAREHREEKREYKREYYKKNGLKINAKSRAMYQKYKAERPEVLREQRRLAAANRRARLEGLPWDLTLEDIAFAFTYANNRCMVCGAEAGLWNTLALDHWWPIAGTDQACPGTVVGNMVILCHVGGHNRAGKPIEIGGCNNSKGTRNPEVWLMGKLGPQQGKKKLKEIHAFFAAAIAFAQQRKEEAS